MGAICGCTSYLWRVGRAQVLADRLQPALHGNFALAEQLGQAGHGHVGAVLCECRRKEQCLDTLAQRLPQLDCAHEAANGAVEVRRQSAVRRPPFAN